MQMTPGYRSRDAPIFSRFSLEDTVERNHTAARASPDLTSPDPNLAAAIVAELDNDIGR